MCTQAHRARIARAARMSLDHNSDEAHRVPALIFRTQMPISPDHAQSSIRPAIARGLPFAIYIAFLAGGDWLAAHLPDPRWVYALQVGAVLIALLYFAREYSELRFAVKSTPVWWMAAIGAGVAVFVLWIHLDVRWLSFGLTGGFDPRLADGTIDWPLAVVRLCGAAVVVPIMEELFWRSFIMRWIDRTDFLEQSPATVSFKALIISSIVFGLEHQLWFAGFLAGLAYGWLYMRTGNLWLPIAAHAVTNLVLGIWVLRTGNWQFW